MTHPDSSLEALLAVLLVGTVTTKTYIDDMEVNGYTIEPGVDLEGANLTRAADTIADLPT